MKGFRIIAGLIISGLLLCGFVFLKNHTRGSGPVIQTSADETIHWYTFQEALEMSKKEKKKIFIDVFTDWCGWCKVMDRNTFPNPVIAKYMNQHFYAVKLNAEMKDTVLFNNYAFVNPSPNTPRSTHQLASSLLNNQMSYPTTVYLDENFSMLTQVPGYRKPEELEPILKFFGEDAFKTQKWEDFSKNFKGEIVPLPAAAPPVVPH
jgi:thioredoxin-related protein